MIGYDSDNIDDIPSSAQLVLYYDDGESGSATSQQLSRFPSSILQSITRKFGTPGYWADLETGTMSILDGVTMWANRQVQGLYIQESNWLSLRQAISAAGLAPPPYWIAAYPSVLPTDPLVPQSWIDLGCVMWQFAGSPGTSPGHYDLNVTAPGFPPIFHPPSLLLIGSTRAAD